MILVTGSTGLVGSHLLYKLTEMGYKPSALFRSEIKKEKVLKTFSYYSDNPEALYKMITWVKGDILDYESLNMAFKGVRKIYHCAASVSFQSSDKSNLTDTNIEGTANIVNLCLEHKIDKLVHVSTIGTLGRADADGIVTEETYWSNKKSSIYSTSKYHAEMEVWRGIAESLNAVIVNPSIILGPGDWNAGSSKLFTTMFNGLKLYSQGTNGFVDVRDVADSLVRLMESEIAGERFIINSENISYKDLFTIMSKEMNITPPYYKATKFMSEIVWRILWVKGVLTGSRSTITKETAQTANQKYFYSNEKITQRTGISFIPVYTSIKDTVKIFMSEQNNV